MDEANRRATRVRRDLVEELRRARIQAGVSQRAVAAELGSQRKKVDARMDRLVLVFGETAANRSAVRAAGEAVRRAFPLTTRQVLSALREGRDPGADGLVFV